MNNFCFCANRLVQEMFYASIGKNTNNIHAMQENLKEAFSTDPHSSTHNKRHKIPHINQPFEGEFSFLRSPI
jgi:hypothetical protein